MQCCLGGDYLGSREGPLEAPPGDAQSTIWRWYSGLKQARLQCKHMQPLPWCCPLHLGTGRHLQQCKVLTWDIASVVYIPNTSGLCLVPLVRLVKTHRCSLPEHFWEGPTEKIWSHNSFTWKKTPNKPIRPHLKSNTQVSKANMKFRLLSQLRIMNFWQNVSLENILSMQGRHSNTRSIFEWF